MLSSCCRDKLWFASTILAVTYFLGWCSSVFQVVRKMDLLEHNRRREIHLHRYPAVTNYNVAGDRGKVDPKGVLRME